MADAAPQGGVKRGQTILVHGANGGVGTTLVQLARHAGIRVIATASPRHHDALRELGTEPIDYDDPQLAARVRELAPGGVDAVFDHLGGPSFERSFGLLARGGTLVAYGTASQRDDTNNLILTFVGLFARLGLWSLKPNGRRALFYDFWAASTSAPGGSAGASPPTSRASSRCSTKARSPRRSPLASRCPRPARRCSSPSRGCAGR